MQVRLAKPGDASGRSAGKRLLAQLELWAKSRGLHRLKLTAHFHNRLAIPLYKVLGFVRKSVKRRSLFIQGSFVDEIYMSKLNAG